MLVEKTYQNDTDGVISPYSNGKVYSFFLKEEYKMETLAKRIIIYGGQVTSNDQDNFERAKIVYQERNGRFVDFDNNIITLPPKDYPFQF